MTQIKKPQSDPKLKQFLEELNELQKTYQYALRAVLNMTPSGITPTISVVNIIPPKADERKAKIGKAKIVPKVPKSKLTN